MSGSECLLRRVLSSFNAILVILVILIPKDTEQDTETVLMHRTLVCSATFIPTRRDYEYTTPGTISTP